MSAAVSGHGLSSAPVVSVVGEAVLRAEPDEAMVLVTLSALEDTPGLALEMSRAEVARSSPCSMNSRSCPPIARPPA
jgi:hypothetical protein